MKTRMISLMLSAVIASMLAIPPVTYGAETLKNGSQSSSRSEVSDPLSKDIALRQKIRCKVTTKSKTSVTVKVVGEPNLKEVFFRFAIYKKGSSSAIKKIKSTGKTYKLSGLTAGQLYRCKIKRCYKNKKGKEITTATSSFRLSATGKTSANNTKITDGTQADIRSERIMLPQTGAVYTNMGKMGKWEAISNVTQFSDSKGNPMIAFKDSISNKLIIATVSDDLRVKKVASLKYKLDILGTVTSDNKGNFYVIWGTRNIPYESSVGLKVTKYNSSWKYVKTISYTGKELNISKAFDAGNCDAAVTGGKLYCIFAMERREGHQQSKDIVVDTAKMKKLKGKKLDFWCSHSFEQRITIDKQGFPWYANHGDAYPRAFLVTNPFGSRQLFHFYCSKEDFFNMAVVNISHAQLGNIAATSRDMFLVSASTRSLKKEGFGDRIDIFVKAYDSNAKLKGTSSRSGSVFGTSTTDKGVRWLTNYGKKYFVNNPQAVATDDDKIVVMWEKFDAATNEFVDSYYTVLDCDGNTYQKTLSMNKARLNAFETPIYKKNCVYWTIGDGSLVSYKLKIDSVI